MGSLEFDTKQVKLLNLLQFARIQTFSLIKLTVIVYKHRALRRSHAQSMDLKYGSMSSADWLWSAIARHGRSGWKRYQTHWAQTVHTRAMDMPTSPALHTCDFMDYAHRLGHAARRSQKSQWLLDLELAKFSLREKWNDGPHPYLTVSAERTKRAWPPENIPGSLTHDSRTELVRVVSHLSQWRILVSF